jgi:hypothetical protein
MTSSKTCRKCGESKAIDEFYKHSQMADGFLNICKKCVKSRVGEHREKNIDKIREYDRTRGKQKERMLSASEVSKRWRKRDSRIMAAHNKVARAIKSGVLERQPCSVCGVEKSYAHHESYNEPLDVVWYCQIHHKERHKIMSIEGIDPLIIIDEEAS